MTAQKWQEAGMNNVIHWNRGIDLEISEIQFGEEKLVLCEKLKMLRTSEIFYSVNLSLVERKKIKKATETVN